MQVGIIENELLKEISERTGLRLSWKGQAMGGIYKGYNITINYFSNRYYINIPIKVTNEYGENEINESLKYIVNKYNTVLLAQYIDNGIKIQWSQEIRNVGQEITIIAIINEVVNFAKDGKLVASCDLCGESNYVVPYMKDGFLVPWCVRCQLKEKEAISLGVNVNQVQGSNLISGVILVTIGALLSSIIWFFVSKM